MMSKERIELELDWIVKLLTEVRDHPERFQDDHVIKGGASWLLLKIHLWDGED